MLHLINQSARVVQHRALDIERLRDASMRAALLSDLLSVLLTAAAALVIARAIGRYRAVAQENQRLRTLRAEELEQFSARVVHDVLNPRNAVSLALELLGRSQDPARRQMALARGRTSIRRAQQITNDLLAFARAGPGPEPGARAVVTETHGGRCGVHGAQGRGCVFWIELPAR